MAKKYDFQLLADGAADGGATAVPGNSPDNTGGVQNGGSADTKNPVAGDKESAKESGVKNTAMRAEEFEKLIRGEYKAEFDSRVQTILDRRFKSQKSMAEELEASKPILDMLSQRYGVNDIEGLKKALDGDKLYWEAGAEKEGLDVEQYKELMSLRAENRRFREAQKMNEQQKFMQNQIENWQRQGDELKASYPEFDMQAELQNRDFQGLLRAGISMKQAYELIHMDEIQAAIKAHTEKSIMDHIRANGERPTENGIKNSNSFVLGKDVASLTREDRAKIAKQAARGEKIIL